MWRVHSLCLSKLQTNQNRTRVRKFPLNKACPLVSALPSIEPHSVYCDFIHFKCSSESVNTTRSCANHSGSLKYSTGQKSKNINQTDKRKIQKRKNKKPTTTQQIYTHQKKSSFQMINNSAASFNRNFCVNDIKTAKPTTTTAAITTNWKLRR